MPPATSEQCTGISLIVDVTIIKNIVQIICIEQKIHLILSESTRLNLDLVPL